MSKTRTQSRPLDRLLNLRLPRPNRVLRRDQRLRGLIVFALVVGVAASFVLHSTLNARLSALYRLAYTSQREGRFIDLTIRQWEYIAHYRPDLATPRYHLGLLFKTSDPQRAVEEMERAVDLGERDPSIFRHLGDTYFAMRRKTSARRNYSEFLRHVAARRADARKYANEIAHVRAALRLMNAN